MAKHEPLQSLLCTLEPTPSFNLLINGEPRVSVRSLKIALFSLVKSQRYINV